MILETNKSEIKSVEYNYILQYYAVFRPIFWNG
jgi:hypothetical protein